MPGNDENRKYHLAFTGRLCRRDGCPALREELEVMEKDLGRQERVRCWGILYAIPKSTGWYLRDGRNGQE